MYAAATPALVLVIPDTNQLMSSVTFRMHEYVFINSDVHIIGFLTLFASKCDLLYSTI